MNDNDYIELEQFFKDKDYKWKIGGIRRHPSASDIKQAVDRAVEMLQGEDYGQLEIGRLIVRREEDRFDLFVMAGEVVNLSNDN